MPEEKEKDSEEIRREQERELKFKPSNKLQLKLVAGLSGADQQSAMIALRHSLGLGSWEIIPDGVETISDEYWDTDDFQLFRQRIGFRLRRKNDAFEITRKSEDSNSDHGPLMDRPEDTIDEVPPDVVLNSMYDSFSLQRRTLLPDLVSVNFRPVLRVDNSRRKFVLRKDGMLFELAFDQFVYSSPLTLRTSIKQGEIEMEAKNSEASERIAELQRDVEKVGLEPSRESKYSRGVKLLRLTAPQLIMKFLEWIDSPPWRFVFSVVGLFGTVASILGLLLVLAT